jgi:hypothetical protein
MKLRAKHKTSEIPTEYTLTYTMTFSGYILLTDKQTSTAFEFSFETESDLLPLRVAYEYISDRTKDRQEEAEKISKT